MDHSITNTKIHGSLESESHHKSKIVHSDIKDEKIFLSLTSLHRDEFDSLSKYFEAAWNEFDEERRSDNIGKGGRYPILFSAQDKLFFILFYLKNYPLQEAIGFLFGIGQPQANFWIHTLSHVLSQALKSAKCLPARISSDLLGKLEEDGIQDVGIDATERRIQRPMDDEEQKKYYSGKKKTHTVKNVIIIGNLDREIKYLSDTVEGKKHDKKIADEAELVFPEGSNIFQDSGFQGYHPEGTNIFQPVKKQKGCELSNEDKESNRLISRIRVVVENVIAGIKRLHIVKDVFRNTKDCFDDLVMILACGLHNFRNMLRHKLC